MVTWSQSSAEHCLLDMLVLAPMYVAGIGSSTNHSNEFHLVKKPEPKVAVYPETVIRSSPEGSRCVYCIFYGSNEMKELAQDRSLRIYTIVCGSSLAHQHRLVFAGRHSSQQVGCI